MPRYPKEHWFSNHTTQVQPPEVVTYNVVCSGRRSVTGWALQVGQLVSPLIGPAGQKISYQNNASEHLAQPVLILVVSTEYLLPNCFRLCMSTAPPTLRIVRISSMIDTSAASLRCRGRPGRDNGRLAFTALTQSLRVEAGTQPYFATAAACPALLNSFTIATLSKPSYLLLVDLGIRPGEQKWVQENINLNREMCDSWKRI